MSPERVAVVLSIFATDPVGNGQMRGFEARVRETLLRAAGREDSPQNVQRIQRAIEAYAREHETLSR